MSKKETNIRIIPPGRIRTEGFVSSGHRCRYCGGKGWFHSGQREPDTIPCPDCGGTGEVTAFVTVEWKPGTEGGQDGQ